MHKKISQFAFHLILIVATISMIGSLYFSNVLGYPPCELCWYQRIAIYPLVAIAAIAIIRGTQREAWYYAVPLVAIGWLISFFHNLLYYNILKEALRPCQAGISCTTKYIEWFGFVTIPLLAFIALTLCGVALYSYYRTYLKKI